MSDKKRIADLERRVRELEMRPLYAPTIILVPAADPPPPPVWPGVWPGQPNVQPIWYHDGHTVTVMS